MDMISTSSQKNRSKTIKIPKFFHELFGSEQTLTELILVGLFAATSTAAAFYLSQKDWQNLSGLQITGMVLLYLDIMGGIVANITRGTTAYYATSPKQRSIFLAIHIQPFLAALCMGGHWLAAGLVWAYSIGAAALTTSLLEHPSQRVIGFFLMALGTFALLLFSKELPTLWLALMAAYIIKVVYSFSVNHYQEDKGHD